MAVEGEASVGIVALRGAGGLRLVLADLQAGYDRIMNPLMWVGVAAAIVATLAVVSRLRRSSNSGPSDPHDLGSVTDGWLSEQRARKDDY